MKNVFILAATSMAAAQLSAATVDWSKLPPAATDTGVTFDKDIAPIFKASCVRCHSGDRARGQLRLDSLEGTLKGARKGPILTAGDSANSLLVKAVSQLDPDTAMPPTRGPRGPRGPMGTNNPAGPMHPGDAPAGGPPAGGPPPEGGPGGPPPGGGGDRPPGGPQGNNPPGMRPMGPATKPLTAGQVGLVRAWIDQGAK